MISQRLERYPFPIAYPAWLFVRADGVADELEKAGHFVELTAAILGVLAVSWCRTQSLSPGGVRMWEEKLDKGGITLDAWKAAIRAGSKAMKSVPDDPVARPIRLAIDAAVRGIENYRDIRNKYAHGGKPRLHVDQREAAEDLDKGVSAILDSTEPLTNLQIGLIRTCRRHADSYMVEVEVMTGYAEPFKVKRLTSPVNYLSGTIIASHHDNLQHAVDLSPYCVWQPCPDCGRNELFYLHQRKKQRSLYFSFTTGHELIIKGNGIQQSNRPPIALGMPPLGSTRAAASYGWRATWADLAPRSRRTAARTVDMALTGLLCILGWLIFGLIGLSFWSSLASAVILGLLYEPVAALKGGTPGKLLLKIEPISTWDGRALSRGDTLRRALVADAQLLFPPLAVRNFAWILWDPARQCLHDRQAKSIVIVGRSRPAQKV